MLGDTEVLIQLEELGQELVAPGTVIRWVSKNLNSANSYTYVGVWTGGYWFITGTGQWYRGNQFSWETMLHEVLLHADVTDIQMATQWVGP